MATDDKSDMMVQTDGQGERRSVAEGTLQDIELDDAVLRANGHKAELPRQFSWISALGLGFSITNSWIGYLSNFGQNLIYGGPQVVIFGLIVAFFVQWIITTGLSELASAFPSSGGQYHFCYILSPPKTRRFAAFVVGWLSILAWWIVTCSGISLASVTLAGLVNFYHPDFVADQWQLYLMYVAVALITLVPLFIAPKKLSWTVQITLYLSLLGFALYFIITLAMHKSAQPGSFLTESNLGTSGWGDGTAWILGITSAMYAFGGTDGAIHISEEVSQPGRRVPQVMAVTMIIGMLTCLPLFIVLMFCMTDLEAVLESTLPSIEIVYQACGNKSVTTFLFIWLWITYIGAIPSQWVASGRIAWAFARDNGVPYSSYFAKVDDTLQFPLRTTIAAFIFACIYGLLYLASTTAFNSIVTSAVLFLNITYVVPQGILLVQGRSKSLPPRYLDLGWFGYFCNVFSVLWIVVLGVFICMPPTLPVTLQSMSYTSVVLVGLFAIVCMLWFFMGRYSFEGPNIDWEMIREAGQSFATSSKEVSDEAR